MLFHSFGPGHDSEEWRSAAEQLASDFEVYAVDLLGWGRSAKPKLDYDDELYLQLVVDFLEDVVRRRAALVAAGLSSAYALQVAVDHPDLVRGLAMSVPSGVHIYGDQASELVHFGADLVNGVATVFSLQYRVFPAVTLHEVYRVAANAVIEDLVAQADGRHQGQG